MVGGLSTLFVITYSNSLNNKYVWDDHEQIVMNPDLHRGAPWSELLSTNVWNQVHPDQKTNYYRPLQMASYRAVSGWFGSDPRVLHLFSLALAVVALLAAFWVYLELSWRPAITFAAAALFAVHPVHSEAVDWISALPEIGCTACLLLSFGIFLSLRHRRPGSKGTAEITAKSWVSWCASLLLFAAALLWKETAVVFPLVIASYVFCIEEGSFAQRARVATNLSLPFWCVMVVYLVARFWVLGFLAVRQRIWGLTPIQTGLSDLHLMSLYWWKLIFPVPLDAYYEFSPVRSLWEVRAIVALFFAALACLAIRYGVRRARLSAFAAVWVFLTLLPVMDIYALGRNVFAERYLYLPSFGFCLLVVLLASVAIKRLPAKMQMPLAALALGAVVLALCWTTIVRNPDWHDDATLFRQTLSRSPNAPFVHFMVASTNGDNLVEAQLHYRKAIELAEAENPPDVLDLTRSYEGLASLYADREEYAQAMEILHRWRAIAPQQPDIDTEEGLILLRSGNWRQAEPFLTRAFAARPQNANLLNALGLLAREYKRNLDEAAAFFSRALAIHTDDDDFRASLQNNLGVVYGDRRQFQLAINEFDSAISIAPRNKEYRTNLAAVLAAVGRRNDALLQLTSVLNMDSNYAPARALRDQLQGQEKQP